MDKILIQVMLRLFISHNDYLEHEDIIDDSVESVSIDYENDRVILICENNKNIPEIIKNNIIKIETITKEHWKYKYLEYHKEIKINDDIYICNNVKAHISDEDYKYIIKLNPKDAFGDGFHSTTRMCLQSLYNITNEKSINGYKSLLDIGTGTGVIAILAEMLGYEKIDAFDIDGLSIDRAIENANINFCKKINFFIADVNKYKKNNKYDIVVANLLSSIIEKSAENIVRLFKKYLILSGVSSKWIKNIVDLLNSKNIQIIDNIEENSWHCLICTKSDRNFQ